MRSFIALELPPAVLDLGAGLQAELQKAGFRGRLAPRDGMHLTLHFLGDIDPDQCRTTGGLLAEVAGRSGCFPIETGGLGAFPNARRPRVYWMGVRPSAELQQLQSALRPGLEALGIPLEDRPYHPHVTLGRARGSVAGGESVFERRHAESVVFDVDRVHLYESRLGPGGARYRILTTARLGGEAGA